MSTRANPIIAGVAIRTPPSSPVATKLTGSVTVQPPSVQPGHPVLVQVCDATGKPISDPTVTVIIQGVPGSSRYFQFPVAGTITLGISASQGQTSRRLSPPRRR
jgi:hypothetical protein